MPLPRFSLVFILIFSICQSHGQSKGIISSNDGLIEYSGRIDFTDPQTPVFTYSGVSARAAFTGTGVSVLLDDISGNNYYLFILDGAVLRKFKAEAGLHAYPAGLNLKDSLHIIELFRLTEQDVGKTYFHGFEIDTGRTLVPLPDPHTRVIEFIGNSITCGFGNEGSLSEGFNPASENHFMTYAAITSRSFSARHFAVCKTGIGMYRNLHGPAMGSPECMGNIYSRLYLFYPGILYNFPVKPDLVCIDLGTNDFSDNLGDSARFVNKYLQFLDTIYRKYNRTDILLLLGPMLGGRNLEMARNCLTFIRDSANRKGQGNVSFFEMSQETGEFGFGGSWHPTVKQHIKNGKELLAFVSVLKDWNITPLALLAETVSGTEISVDFNTSLIDNAGQFGGFRVFAHDSLIPIISVSTNINNPTALKLKLSKRLLPGDTITMSYRDGSVHGAGNSMLAPFKQFPVTNNLEIIRPGEEGAWPPEILVFPNPVIYNRVQYALGKQYSLDDASVSVYDLYGRLITSEKISGSSGTINLGGSAGLRGAFLACFRISGNIYVKKFFILN